MRIPTIEEVYAAKAEVAKRLKGHGELAGIGIVTRDGRLLVQVSWRNLPPEAAAIDRVGDVEVAHQAVGTIHPLPPDDTA
jgi:hypothetical protein